MYLFSENSLVKSLKLIQEQLSKKKKKRFIEAMPIGSIFVEVGMCWSL
jgi:hypothetical protein